MKVWKCTFSTLGFSCFLNTATFNIDLVSLFNSVFVFPTITSNKYTSVTNLSTIGFSQWWSAIEPLPTQMWTWWSRSKKGAPGLKTITTTRTPRFLRTVCFYCVSDLQLCNRSKPWSIEINRKRRSNQSIAYFVFFLYPTQRTDSQSLFICFYSLKYLFLSICTHILINVVWK